jgi:hypothetical protein
MDRLSMLVTLLLATCTYSLVVGSSLPNLGYLTWIDKFVLGVFGYIGLVTAEVVALEWTEYVTRPLRPLTFLERWVRSSRCACKCAFV